jgi:RNA polymerase II-associated protein 1
MSLRGQRFELDLDADEFTANPLSDDHSDGPKSSFSIGEIKEKTSGDHVPPPPAFKATRSGFPEHKSRFKASAFKQQQSTQAKSFSAMAGAPFSTHDAPRMSIQVPPSDKAIVNHMGKKYGYDFESQQKAEISQENRQKIAQMSDADIEEARAELMANLDPALIERLLKRANIDDVQDMPHDEVVEDPSKAQEVTETPEVDAQDEQPQSPPVQHDAPLVEMSPAMHFPAPPRSADSFKPLDPDDPDFLADLKKQYFPELPQDPSALSWMQDVTPKEVEESSYNPTSGSYSPSSLRFSFRGTLIPPKEALTIEVSKGLHHHGEDAGSAGYTISELTLLARSTLPNQRSVAYQVLGRILYRLGKGELGPRGSELNEGLWGLIEHERPIEIMMSEANRATGHVTAKSYATEALWLWRKGSGGDRGVLKEREKIAK